MDNELLQEKIEAYLNKTLSGDELIAFEKQLATDKELAKEVFLVKDTNEAVEDLAIEAEYLPQLEVLNKKYFQKAAVEKRKPNNSRMIIIVLIGIFALVLGFFVGQYFKESTSTEVEEELIFASYYQPYAADELTRGENGVTTTYETAITFYNESNFAAAIPILKEYTADSINAIPAQILLANCYLSSEPKQVEAAINLLKALSTDNTHSFTEVAQWYLALAFIDKKDLVSAQPILQEIADKDIGKYPKMAKEVLIELGK
jgi:hypothetical protein